MELIIENNQMSESLFELIKKQQKKIQIKLFLLIKIMLHLLITLVKQFAPKFGHKPSVYQETDLNTVISLKAETHNFPTTVEPFSGAATGSGGEIRDRLAGTRIFTVSWNSSLYTPYPRFENQALALKIELVISNLRNFN